MTSRRQFMAGMALASVAPSLTWAAVGNPVALTAAMDRDGAFLIVGLTAAGEIAFRQPLPARGHAAAAHPHLAEAVAIARRPGTFAKVVDCATGAIRQTIATPNNRHFYGHATFSLDGRLLYTTEQDIVSGQGRIGVWARSDGYKRVDEFPSGGIGPHEILTLASGDLAVANGGIRTHPETGRAKLNLDTMRPNLSILSPTGKLIDVAPVPADTHHNSLRHIAATMDGTIVCGFQWQGDPFAAPPLVAFYKGSGELVPAQFSDGATHGLDGYIGSVCTLGHTGFAASAPRGGRVLIFDETGTQTGTHRATDVCGLTSFAQGGSLATDGFGNVFDLAWQDMRLKRAHGLAFDNHLVSLSHGFSSST
ncbi:DUF1513 domain-containing protein [Roseobacter denitrificans]|uniref:Twin-arginine translocation pathway signal n=1 Tax=Roseobacter denitrificans (strain ATCC 33942 / OCh 114) TaxID=375451 RepID=Q16BS0_ROSDO|nr:DUF1513 domain-containing protein [Roseobacter denitrificans]ABG30573.1 conserved hypothetical protein [Roseobacter denitrificans OCh 114]AVL53718.1 DUF1513 domain-containing protein [Roseobacter denitrificans]SFG20115.1 hypothetical protein SAMN05443635_109194 [Roseobacter denitrificans OCh 114]